MRPTLDSGRWARRPVRAAGLATMVLLGGCATSDESSAKTKRATHDASTYAVAPVTLRCQFRYRETDDFDPDSPEDPKAAFAEEELIVGAGQSEDVTLGKLVLHAGQGDEPGLHGGSFHISVSAGGKQLVEWLYQFDPAEPPRDQFAGGNGFTGLVYLTHPTEGGDYQLTCRAAREKPRIARAHR